MRTRISTWLLLGTVALTTSPCQCWALDERNDVIAETERDINAAGRMRRRLATDYDRRIQASTQISVHTLVDFRTQFEKKLAQKVNPSATAVKNYYREYAADSEQLDTENLEFVAQQKLDLEKDLLDVYSMYQMLDERLTDEISEWNNVGNTEVISDIENLRERLTVNQDFIKKEMLSLRHDLEESITCSINSLQIQLDKNQLLFFSHRLRIVLNHAFRKYGINVVANVSPEPVVWQKWSRELDDTIGLHQPISPNLPDLEEGVEFGCSDSDSSMMNASLPSLGLGGDPRKSCNEYRGSLTIEANFLFTCNGGLCAQICEGDDCERRTLLSKDDDDSELLRNVTTMLNDELTEIFTFYFPNHLTTSNDNLGVTCNLFGDWNIELGFGGFIIPDSLQNYQDYEEALQKLIAQQDRLMGTVHSRLNHYEAEWVRQYNREESVLLGCLRNADNKLEDITSTEGGSGRKHKREWNIDVDACQGTFDENAERFTTLYDDKTTSERYRFDQALLRLAGTHEKIAENLDIDLASRMDFRTELKELREVAQEYINAIKRVRRKLAETVKDNIICDIEGLTKEISGNDIANMAHSFMLSCNSAFRETGIDLKMKTVGVKNICELVPSHSSCNSRSYIRKRPNRNTLLRFSSKSTCRACSNDDIREDRLRQLSSNPRTRTPPTRPRRPIVDRTDATNDNTDNITIDERTGEETEEMDELAKPENVDFFVNYVDDKFARNLMLRLGIRESSTSGDGINIKCFLDSEAFLSRTN
eukprot:scaffold28626_cov58-Attheya_sp.AAC.3